MPIGRIKSFPYPERIDSIPSIQSYLQSLYRSLTEEQVENILDFEDMDVDSLIVNTLDITDKLEITPSAALTTEDAHWDGINIDGDALDPSAAGVHIHGIHVDLSGITVGSLPHLDGLHIEMPAELPSPGTHGIHTNCKYFAQLDATSMVAGQVGTALDMVIDAVGATGGKVHMLDTAVVGLGGGTFDITAVGTHTGVNVIHQHIGTATAFDAVLKYDGSTYSNVTAACIADNNDVTLWDAQGDEVYFGHSTTFDEIECIWATPATKNMHFTFWFSTGTSSYTEFDPADDTNGAQLSGLVRWLASDISWATGTVDGITKYWIKIIRTRRVGTAPIEDTVKFIKGTTYSWDKLGAITSLSLSTGTIGCGTITTTGNLVLPANGVVGVTDGNPQIVFDNANNWLEITGNVGIGTPSPDNPLSFATALGNKIDLYDRDGSDIYGFGIQSNLLQIIVPGTEARIGIGYGNSGSFTETLTIKGNKVGIGIATPYNPLEVLSSTQPQVRITHTNNVDYLTIDVNSDGDATILASGGDISFGNENLVTTGTFGCAALTATGTVTIPTALTGVIRADSGVLSVEATAVLDADFGSAGLCATDGSGTYSIVADNSSTWNAAQAGDTALTNLSTVATTANRYLRITGTDAFDERTYANVLSDIGGAASGHNMSTHGDVSTYSINTSGTLTAGNATLGTIGSADITVDSKLVLSAGSITDGDGAISFGDENLSTTGTLNVSSNGLSVGEGAGVRVGISTNNPADQLDVNGNIRLSKAENPTIHFYSGATQEAWYAYNSSDKRFEVQNYNNGSYGVITMNHLGGNVGIGVSDPDAALEVAGTLHFGGAIYTFPGADGNDGQVLKTDGSGALAWIDAIGEGTPDDHGALTGLADDDHIQYIVHTLAGAANDFLVASGANTYVKQTLAATGAILEGDIQHNSLQGSHSASEAVTAYGWGDHASGGYAAASHAMSTHGDEDTYNISTSGTLGAGNTTLGTIGCNEITIADGHGINLQEDITFTGASTENIISVPDELQFALDIKEGATSYMHFDTRNGNEKIAFSKTVAVTGAVTWSGGGSVATNTHISSTGSDHGYLDQSVISGANVNFGTIGSGTITIANGSSISLQETITFTGANHVNRILMPDELQFAFAIEEGSNQYMHFDTRADNEAVVFSQDVEITGALSVTGCVTDGTCEIMKDEDALAIINNILEMGTGEDDEYKHERMDMKAIHTKYPFMIKEQLFAGKEGKEEVKYLDKLGAKSDLLYVAIRQLVERIEALEAA